VYPNRLIGYGTVYDATSGELFTLNDMGSNTISATLVRQDFKNLGGVSNSILGTSFAYSNGHLLVPYQNSSSPYEVTINCGVTSILKSKTFGNGSSSSSYWYPPSIANMTSGDDPTMALLFQRYTSATTLTEVVLQAVKYVPGSDDVFTVLGEIVLASTTNSTYRRYLKNFQLKIIASGKLLVYYSTYTSSDYWMFRLAEFNLNTNTWSIGEENRGMLNSQVPIHDMNNGHNTNVFIDGNQNSRVIRCRKITGLSLSSDYSTGTIPTTLSEESLGLTIYAVMISKDGSKVYVGLKNEFLGNYEIRYHFYSTYVFSIVDGVIGPTPSLFVAGMSIPDNDFYTYFPSIYGYGRVGDLLANFA
jgi:hypothetical protein